MASRSKKNSKAIVVSKKNNGRRQKAQPVRQNAAMVLYEKPQNYGSTVSYAPASVGVLKSFSGPNSKRRWRFKNRELIGSIAGTSSSTVPTVTTYHINPGLSDSFPWLSGEADKWEQYSFIYLVYEWVPAGGTSATGFAILSPEYDASESNPTTLAELSNTEGAKVCRVWENFVSPMDRSNMHALGPRKYIRASNQAGDVKTYDVGKIHVATIGQGDTNTAGQLWVNYEIEFHIPQNSIPLSGPKQTSYFRNFTAQTFADPESTPVNLNQIYDPLGFGENDGASTYAWTPAAGFYHISLMCTFNDSSDEDFKVTLYMFKNGAAFTYNAYASEDTSSGTTAELNLAVQAVEEFNGTDTFSIEAIVVGVAGTLTIPINMGSMIVRLA
jgi:hypothetical protein